MNWVLLLVVINTMGGVAVHQVEMPSEEACNEAMKTVMSGMLFIQPDNAQPWAKVAGATCLSRIS